MIRAILTLMTGLWGGATMLAMVGKSGPDDGLVLSAAIAAALAGAVMAPLFGRAHPLWAFVTPVLATSLGAALVGAYVGFPGDIGLGLTFAPLMVWGAILQSPVILWIWLIGAIALRRVAYSLK